MSRFGGEYNMNNNSADSHLIQKLRILAQEVLSEMGLEILEIQQQQQGGEKIILIRVDRLDEQPVTMSDITKASRAAGVKFDEEDPVQGEYRLELESPGAKRPLTRARHFERMVGLKAKVKTSEQGFTAQIKSVQGDVVTFSLADEEVSFRVDEMQANLAEFPPSHR